MSLNRRVESDLVPHASSSLLYLRSKFISAVNDAEGPRPQSRADTVPGAAGGFLAPMMPLLVPAARRTLILSCATTMVPCF